MTETVPINVTWLILLVGFALPFLVDVFVPTRWGSRGHTLSLLVACVLAVTAIDLINSAADSLSEIVGDSVLLFLIAVGLSLGFWRPMGVTGRNGTIIKKRNGDRKGSGDGS